MRFRLHELVTDEKGKLSAGRVGLWITVIAALVTGGIDVYLTWLGIARAIPNTVYALLGTMFTAFATMVAGPRIGAYIGPQIGSVAQGIGAANRDERLPSKQDDERHGGQD